VPEKGWVGGAR